ncbi:MAG: DUF1080 domain-containing protein [Opitutaceae bacterium]|nr:DUF1080 domain-containing protein [Opitutaceae bacterium]
MIFPYFPSRPGRSVWSLLSSAALCAAVSLHAQAAKSSAAAPATKAEIEAGWQSLFDGKTLAGWAQSGFEAEGPVKVENPFRGGPGAIVIAEGTMLSGITSTRGSALPRMNYEITLEAMKLEGSDFFCALTFPVGKSECSLVVGGWGGMVVGISSVDYSDASENDTTTGMAFADNRWYRIRVRVTAEKIEAWIDAQQVVDLEHKDRKITMRPGDIEKSVPLGIATYQTRSAVRDIKLRRL